MSTKVIAFSGNVSKIGSKGRREGEKRQGGGIKDYRRRGLGKERVIEWLKASSEESRAKDQEESFRWISSDSAIAQVQLRKIEFETNIQTNPQGFIHVFTGPQ